MKKLLLLIALFGLYKAGHSQCLTITSCPSDSTPTKDPGVCGAVFTYPTPTFSSTCVSNSSDTFSFTGAVEYFVVPAGVTSVTSKVFGAQGGANWVNNTNYGGYAEGKISVTPGDTLFLYVGEQPNGLQGGFNGGGNGEGGGQGGGGASDIRIGNTALTSRIIVAGGGGGAGFWNGQHVVGGAGGGLSGGAGYRNVLGTSGGSPGTQTGSGNGTCGFLNNPAVAGGFGYGGSTASCGCEGYGGGGGYYGGAAGGNCRGGGGGSGFISPSLSDSSMNSGVQVGHGKIILEYNSIASLTQTSGLVSGSTFPVGTTTNVFLVTNGIDSVTCSFDVTVQAPTSTIAPIACNSYTSPSGKIWTATNTYQDTVATSYACDSIITVNLIVNNSSTSTIAPVVCDSYTSPSGKVWTTTNTYLDTIPNSVNCDSIITVNLTNK